MAAGWQPSGAWNMKFRQALFAAFDEPTLELLTTDYFSPNGIFSKISAPGFHKTFAFRLQELINAARMGDWLLDLVAAAHERRPKNSAIAVIAEDLGLTIAGPRLDNPTGTPLQNIIQANAQFIVPAVFRQELSLLEGQVCWIDIPGGGGTGFLVGPDLVLTNDHVIERVRQGQARWQDVRCRFDYKRAVDGSTLDNKKLPQVALHATEPLVDRRPPSQFDWIPALGNAGPEEIDAALLRLAEPIGDLPVGGDTVDPEAQPRGWIDANIIPPSLSTGNQVFLLQHPKGEPLQLAIGTVKEFNASGTRLRYDANSKDGSSGSPCFNADLQLVALHHAHDLAYPPQWNQAIPFSSVQKVWHDHNIVVP